MLDVVDGVGVGCVSVDDDDVLLLLLMMMFVMMMMMFGEEVLWTSTSGGGGDEDDVERSKVVEMLSWLLRVFLFKNFFSDEECEYLIEFGEKKLE